MIDIVGPPDFEDLAADIEAMRKRIVEELLQTESARAELVDLNTDLARSNIELEQFAYVASHDLQEPLRKVASFVQLLQQRYEGQLDERADEYIEYAADGAKRMQVLINNLLEFSRVGRSNRDLELVELGGCLEVALANLGVAVREADAKINVGSLPTVLGDQGLLTVLWQNLIGNSLKFRSEGDCVIDVDASRVGPDWEISVTDNGIGIDPRFSEKIFVIFQRLNSRDAYGGTGIGLAMCKKIVEFHKGRIWLDSENESGSTMRFTIPLVADGVGA
jgi:light-regulated signal transduction histidine kinase (bacteriophytochrome)